MNISEETFTSWSQGPSKTEAEKCENAETAVKKAIAADEELAKLDVSVFAQGSYRGRTNVRQDSDVDICVRYNTAFFPEYPEGKTGKDFGHGDSALRFSDFKNKVERALKSYFGATSVARGKKAFDVHANSYRIDADVVPTYVHRRYSGNKNSDGSDHFYEGVAFLPDEGSLIKNWPEQTYDNGISRNDATGRRHKRLIRIFKRLRNKMQEDNKPEASNIASFLIECLVWNAPLEAFQLLDACKSCSLDITFLGTQVDILNGRIVLTINSLKKRFDIVPGRIEQTLPNLSPWVWGFPTSTNSPP